MKLAPPLGQLVKAAATAAFLLGMAGLALAASVRLDDSGSYATQLNVQMQWRSALPRSGPRSQTEVQVRVQIRINTRPFMGQQGRIYMVLPLDVGPPITAEWQTQGRLMAGRVLSGGRALVYTGPIASATLEDQLLILLRSEGDWSANSRKLNFHFELDTP
jgi:hypothetical protein